MRLYSEYLENWGLSQHADHMQSLQGLRGTFLNGQVIEDKIPNYTLMVPDSQVKPGKKYLPIRIGMLRDGKFAWYGNQLAFENGNCSQYNSGLCSDYNNRPYQCRVYPLIPRGEGVELDINCPVSKKMLELGINNLDVEKKFNEDLQKYHILGYLMNAIMDFNVINDHLNGDLIMLYHVHPQTKIETIPSQKYNLLIDIEEYPQVAKFTVKKGEEKQELLVKLRTISNPDDIRKLASRLVVGKLNEIFQIRLSF